VCPDCQRQAAVGVQCVDCVNEAARATASTPAGRTPLGGRRHAGPPVVTIGIIAVCVISYVLQLVSPGWTRQWLFAPVIGADEPWRFLTAAFLHSPGGYLHIIANMIALWMIGPFLETALGRARYLTLYLLSAVAGSVACLLLAEPLGTWYTAVVGASGAVFGLFGAVLVVLRKLKGNAAGILGVIVLNVVIGFVVPGIAWQAHLGGLVVGALLGAAYAYAPPARRALTAWLAPVVVGGALLVATVAVYTSYGLL